MHYSWYTYMYMYLLARTFLKCQPSSDNKPPTPPHPSSYIHCITAVQITNNDLVWQKRATNRLNLFLAMLRTTIIAPIIPILLYLKDHTPRHVSLVSMYITFSTQISTKSNMTNNEQDFLLGRVAWQLFSNHNMHVILENKDGKDQYLKLWTTHM